MAEKIHTLYIEWTKKLISEISKIDRFDAHWSQIEKREGQTLKHLKEIATVRSVGASTRIEGSKMTDNEVSVLIEKIKIAKLQERDEQEVAGYFEALDTLAESYRHIEISESNLKNLHNILMRHSTKDNWHRGNYKQVSNALEVNYPNGANQIIFKTAEPGLNTEEAMKELFEWYYADKDTPPLIKIAVFVYDFLSIHPFQDGNGRLSRLLTTLLLLRDGYSWIQYVSFEHEIENRKSEYYDVLMQTQKLRPGERVDNWITFFLNCLLNIQDQLTEKLRSRAHSLTQLSPKEKNILAFIENHPGSKSGEIAKKLDIPLSTVKKMLTVMATRKLIYKYGVGAGTNYIAEKKNTKKTDFHFQLTSANPLKEFLLTNPDSFIEIKRIILTPLFSWERPEEWSTRLTNQGIYFKISGTDAKKSSFGQPYFLAGPPFNFPFYFKPDFKLQSPINIPLDIKDRIPDFNEYPINIRVELFSSSPTFDFDVMFIYDEVS